jgi:hypothetical protein
MPPLSTRRPHRDVRQDLVQPAPSNTEPLLRLNVEAPDEATMIGMRDEVLTVVRE